MKKPYLLIFSNVVGSREEIVKVLDQMSTVITWMYDIPNVIYVISEYSAQELYEEFAKLRSTEGRFMFAEITSNLQGMMMEDTWFLFENKYNKPDSD